MAKSQKPHPEIVLQLRMKHSASDQKWRVILEGPEPNRRIRFDNFCELTQYLKALSQPEIPHGLR
jgi:hypothetical protein